MTLLQRYRTPSTLRPELPTSHFSFVNFSVFEQSASLLLCYNLQGISNKKNWIVFFPVRRIFAVCDDEHLKIKFGLDLPT